MPHPTDDALTPAELERACHRLDGYFIPRNAEEAPQSFLRARTELLENLQRDLDVAKQVTLEQFLTYHYGRMSTPPKIDGAPRSFGMALSDGGVSGPVKQNPDGTWSPAEPMPIYCEEEDCEVSGDDVKPYHPNQVDLAALDDEDRENGWDKEPVSLCSKHADNRIPYVAP